MAIVAKSRRSDGTVTASDTDTGQEWILTAEDWARVTRLPAAEQRAAVLAAVESRRADPTGGRTESDQRLMDAADQGQGERAQDQEGPR